LAGVLLLINKSGFLSLDKEMNLTSQ